VTSDTPSDRFTSLAPLLQDILTLSETTQIEGVDPYNKDKRQNGSTGAGGRSVSSRKGQAWREQERGGGHQAHLFTGKRGHHMDFALLYPMLAALRAMVEDGPEGPQRIGGFSARPGAGARAGSPCARRHRPVIAKTFLSAKTFRAYGTAREFLSPGKKFSGSWPYAGPPDVIRRHTSALMHHEPPCQWPRPAFLVILEKRQLSASDAEASPSAE
jgi:hypothetical protein